MVCWTAMIAAYQQHGLSDGAIELFENMLEKNITPNYMANIHSINPGPEHYACMVDLLGQAG